MAQTTFLPPEIEGLPEAIRKIADVVRASSELMKELSDFLPNETRNIVVEVINMTSRPLTRITHNFDHGGFGPTLPQGQVAPFKSDVFTVESSGIATGVEGSVTYTAEGVGDFLIGFTNPFIGTNSFNVNASGVEASLHIIGAISTGNHAHARFAIVDRSDPIPSMQSEWCSCPKCQGMHFAGFPNFKGVCPAGGQHEQTNSFSYKMIFNSRPSSHVQSEWRSCRKCQGLFFGPFKGVCPAGGQHDEKDSFTYAIMFDLPPAANLQLEWRSCRKCQGLFFGPFKGVCPAGGQHDETGSFNYGLRFV